MAGSGVSINDEVTGVLTDIQMGRKHRYIIFKMSDDFTSVDVAKKSEADAGFSEFYADMQEAEKKGECRYAVYNVQYNTSGGGTKDKLALITWTPDTSKVKQKMLYASTKQSLISVLGKPVGVHLQISDYDDLTEDHLLEKVKKFDKA